MRKLGISVSVKGTRFVLSVDENGFTDVFTLEGLVNVKNKMDNNQVDVGVGQKAHSTGKDQILLSEYSQNEIDDYNVPSSETLNINLENEDGEKKTIKIELE